MIGHSNTYGSIRPEASLIYLCEIKRFDPFKFSIYAWCIKIAIAGSLAPVRLAWVPFPKVPKNGFIYLKADTMHDYSLIHWDQKFINSSKFKLFLCGASDH